jgi:26S proteasome regulatory subunit N5
MSHSGAASGGELEEKLDISAEVDSKLEQAKALAASNQLKESLTLLTALEKRCRVGNDTPSLCKVCQAVLNYCKDSGEFELLITNLQALSTRRSQKSAAISAMIQEAMPWVLEGPTRPKSNGPFPNDQRDALIVAMREITDGKLFLEAERARLTRALAAIKVRLLFKCIGDTSVHCSELYFQGTSRRHCWRSHCLAGSQR